jgi:hypothetical protein
MPHFSGLWRMDMWTLYWWYMQLQIVHVLYRISSREVCMMSQWCCGVAHYELLKYLSKLCLSFKDLLTTVHYCRLYWSTLNAFQYSPKPVLLVRLFNRGFPSWMNTAKTDRVQPQITRYACTLFLSPTVFKKCPIFWYIPYINMYIQGGSNMTGSNCDLFTHKSSLSYLNHLVFITYETEACFNPVIHNFTGGRENSTAH